MQSKIRDATLQKIPYILVIGGREEKMRKVAVRTRAGKDLGVKSLDEFMGMINKDIESKKVS